MSMSTRRKGSAGGIQRRGTKRFPRGRLVIGPGKGVSSLSVVVGSEKVGSRTEIATSLGSGKASDVELFRSSEISPVVIRRSVAGLKGKGSIKPRVKGPITEAKIKTLRTTTQATLNRAGG